MKRAIALSVAIVLSAVSVGPALAWWQFVAWSPSGERKVYARYANEQTCKAALEKVDGQLARKFPHLFPRVGSCEEYK
jgi:hypothetical protein